MTLVMFQAGPNLEDMVVDILEVMVDILEELENMLEDLEVMVVTLERGTTVDTTVDIGNIVVDMGTLGNMGNMGNMDSAPYSRSRRVLPSPSCKGESDDIKEVRCPCQLSQHRC